MLFGPWMITLNFILISDDSLCYQVDQSPYEGETIRLRCQVTTSESTRPADVYFLDSNGKEMDGDLATTCRLQLNFSLKQHDFDLNMYSF